MSDTLNEDHKVVAVSHTHGMTLVMDSETTSALANLLADLEQRAPYGVTGIPMSDNPLPMNYYLALLGLRREAFHL